MAAASAPPVAAAPMKAAAHGAHTAPPAPPPPAASPRAQPMESEPPLLPGAELPRAAPPAPVAAPPAEVTPPPPPTAAAPVDKPREMPRVALVVIKTTEGTGAAMRDQLEQLDLTPTWALHTVPGLSPQDGVRGAFLSPTSWSVGRRGEAPLPRGWTTTEAMRALSHLSALKAGAAAAADKDGNAPSHVVVLEDSIALHFHARKHLIALALADWTLPVAALAWTPQPPSPEPALPPAMAAAVAAAAASAAAPRSPASDTAAAVPAVPAASSPAADDAAPPRKSPPPLEPVQRAVTAQPIAEIRASVAAYMMPVAEAARLVAAHLRASVGEFLETVPEGSQHWDALLQAAPVRNIPLAVLRDEPHPWRTDQHVAAMRAAVTPVVAHVLRGNRVARELSFGAVNPGIYWRTPHWGSRDAVRLVHANKKIGVMMHNQDAFANGCMQNGYFLYKALREMGYHAEMILETPRDDIVTKRIPFARGLMGEELHIKPLRAGSDEMMEYGMIIYSTRTPSRPWAAALEAHDIARISFKCGNTYFLDAEELVNAGENLRRGYPPMHDRYHAEVSDELWLVSLLAHLKTYYRTVCRLPVYEIPHLWAMDFFDAAYRSERRLPPPAPGAPPPRPNWDGTLRKTSRERPVDLISLEPHVSMVKHSLLIMAIGQALYDRSPERMGVLHLYSWTWTETAEKILEGFPVYRIKGADGKRKHVELHNRDRVTFIADRFCRSENPAIILHHQMCNAANYAELEFAELGFPICHNSKIYGTGGTPDVPSFGYYYVATDDLFDIDGAVDQILLAADTHGSNDADQRVRARMYGQAHNDPSSKVVQHQLRAHVKGAMDRCMAKREAADARQKPTARAW